MTIVMTSSELVELCSICDRIAIICEGKVAGVLPPDASPVEFGLMMSGISGQAGPPVGAGVDAEAVLGEVLDIVMEGGAT